MNDMNGNQRMNKIQLMETLNQIQDKIYDAMDDVNEIDTPDTGYQLRAAKVLVTVAMDLDRVIDDLNDEAIKAGERSGAV